MLDNAVKVFTDGGCVPNPGPGAWAALLLKRDRAKFLSGYAAQTTNNQMELSAAINALRAFKKNADVWLHTDSKYVKDGIESWIAKWRANGWKTADKKPVKNKELWIELADEIASHRVHWDWVQSHAAENRFNNFVDWLVEDTIKNRVGQEKEMSVDELEKYIDTLKLRIWR